MSSSIMVANNAAAVTATATTTIANEFMSPDKRRRGNRSVTTTTSAASNNKNKRHGVVGYLSWDDNFIRLQKFKQEFQTVNVPQNNDHPKNKHYSGLGNWVNHQRRRYRDGRLQREPDKIQKLDDIGFKWAQRPQKKANTNKNTNNGKQRHQVKTTAYIIYSNAIRDRITRENPDASYGDVAKLISASYRKLSQNELTDLEYKAAANDGGGEKRSPLSHPSSSHPHHAVRGGAEDVQQVAMEMADYKPPPPAEFEYCGEIHGI